MRFFFFPMVKQKNWTKFITNILTTSQESLYCQECSNESKSKAISKMDIVVGGAHGQEKFRSVHKFIVWDVNVNNLDSYVIKNDHIDCGKDTSDVLNESIVKPLNDEMKIIMNEYMFVLC